MGGGDDGADRHAALFQFAEWPGQVPVGHPGDDQAIHIPPAGLRTALEKLLVGLIAGQPQALTVLVQRFSNSHQQVFGEAGARFAQGMAEDAEWRRVSRCATRPRAGGGGGPVSGPWPGWPPAFCRDSPCCPCAR